MSHMYPSNPNTEAQPIDRYQDPSIVLRNHPSIQILSNKSTLLTLYFQKYEKKEESSAPSVSVHIRCCPQDSELARD
jgi:hypothetical protein